MKRVVITGYGIISALGNNVDIFWKNIAEGKSGIKLIEDPEFSDIPTRIAAYIESFDAEKYMNKKDIASKKNIAVYTKLSGNNM